MAQGQKSPKIFLKSRNVTQSLDPETGAGSLKRLVLKKFSARQKKISESAKMIMAGQSQIRKRHQQLKMWKIAGRDLTPAELLSVRLKNCSGISHRA
jgi:hypothetical protein